MKIKIIHARYGLGDGEIYEDTNGYSIKVKFHCGDTITFDYNFAFTKGILKLADPNAELPVSLVPLSKTTTSTTKQSSSKPDITTILKSYIADFNQKQHLPFVVKESIPIVWFGDMDAYFNSNIKIVTIGLNPSEQEFLTKDAFGKMVTLPNNKKRFDIIKFDKGSVNEQVKELESTLNNYFKKSPYKWFDKYEKLLDVKECSYYTNKRQNTAIHIDLFSAIATSPTWGKLNDQQKSQIANKKLFCKLLEILNPDFVLCSVANDTFSEVFNNYDTINKKVFDGNNYIRVYKEKGSDRIILNGRNMRGIPWGGITEELSKILVKYPYADCTKCKNCLSNNCGGVKLCSDYKG